MLKPHPIEQPTHHLRAAAQQGSGLAIVANEPLQQQQQQQQYLQIIHGQGAKLWQSPVSLSPSPIKTACETTTMSNQSWDYFSLS